MASTYGERVKQARLNAGLSQAELGRQVGSTPQAIQYLEDPEKNARGSEKTARIAHICGVSALWLETGDGEMLPDRAREPGASYAIHSATSIAKAIKTLRPELRQALGTLVSYLAVRDDATIGQTGRAFSISAGEQARAPVRQRTARRRSA